MVALPKISIIIPTWQEAPLIEDAVCWAQKTGEEVIVADAGSPDGTADIASRASAKVVLSVQSRGIQLHAGAQTAGGDILLFLHADARLPIADCQAMLNALADPRVIGGNFFRGSCLTPGSPECLCRPTTFAVWLYGATMAIRVFLCVEKSIAK